MNLFKQWEEIADIERSENEHNEFWNKYFDLEQHIYKELLADNKTSISGRFCELAEKFGMSNVDFAGFVSGINDSLVNLLDVEELTKDSEIDATIDFEKLFYNMHKAEADWLYNLPEWDGILSKEKRKEIKAAYNSTKTIVKENKTGRNDPCPCGSGKKYKKCCGK